MKLVTTTEGKPEKFAVYEPGRSFHLNVEPGHDGVVLVYTLRRKIENPPPSFIAEMVGINVSSDNFFDKPVMQQYIELKWWEKLLRISLESKALRKANKMHSELNNILAQEKLAKRIKSSLLGVE